MNNKFVIALVCVITFLAIFPFFINVSFMGWRTSITFGSTESWIGFFASYFGAIFGGVIGGLFTYLGVRQTINTQTKQKYIDEFPEKIKLLTDVLFKLKGQRDSFNNNEYFIKGLAQYERPSEYFDLMSSTISSAAESGNKIDGALYEKMKEIRERKDNCILKSANHPLISLVIADDEFGTNARVSLESINFRRQVQAEITQIINDLISIFEDQLIKMEQKFKQYIK
ncbi:MULTISPECIES: hypothetical protein [Paenibacillus]|nr:MULTISPECIES: hypothetical protein [Paenibacillus]PNQ79317.1 hypothetical protein C1T21_20250 [Paenibacillus sp. F4]SFR27857.1 hypothetical protein SAMN04488603_1252 [Paenibacillus sp. cl130]